MRYIILILTFLLCAAHTAFANDNGYIIQADVNDARLVCVPEENVVSRRLGIYSVDTAEELDSFCSEYSVEYWEENSEVALMDIPDDSGYNNRWDAPLLKLPRVWDYSLNLSNVNVAVLDTGISSGHNDFDYDRITGVYNLCADSYDVEDDIKHGTNVAGIIGARRDNGIGTFGIADGVNLLIFKVFSKDCSRSLCIISALTMIYEQNIDVDVINMSIGFGYSDILQSVINKLAERGVIIVAAAGNAGTTKKSYPASCENVISVGSVGTALQISSFSQYNNMVDVTAPGEKIYTTSLSNSYLSPNGTSFSSPYVAAAAALVKAADKSIDHDGFMELIKNTSLDKGKDGYDEYYGWGILQPLAILDSLSESCGLMYRNKTAVISNIQSADGKTEITVQRASKDYDVYIPVYGKDGSVSRVYKETVSSGDGTDKLVIDGLDNFDESSVLFCWDKSLRPMYKSD